MIRFVPNILTMLRILLVPVFIWFFFYSRIPHSLIWAAVIFVIAEITDYLDGKIARKYNVISNFGKVMDPLADKILTGTALIGIAVPPFQLISVVTVIVIIFREVAVSILRQVYVKRKIYLPANNWGKIKTVSQMTGLTITIIYLALVNVENYVISMIIYYYFWLVALITALSGVSYFIPLFFPARNGESK
ncbi:MAG: CDP-diacylglycerol--glycerol-3-phosphate 3-phosphatidyltransferase [Candidatus Cloacimonetes bacterium]|nr:CDP-diacylglycerol--glycerol-3-phosphate 3-phosphatidyltransferase [Candidatus Cloacimonadota bacterium]